MSIPQDVLDRAAAADLLMGVKPQENVADAEVAGVQMDVIPQAQPPVQQEQFQATPEVAPQTGMQSPNQSAAQPVAPVASAGNEMEKLQHRFNVLQGKYNAEVGGTLAKNAQLESQVTQLQGQMQQLMSQQQAAPAQAPAPVTPAQMQTFDPSNPQYQELVDGLGAEYVEGSGKIAQQVAQQAVAPMMTQMQQMQQTFEKQQDDAFWRQVDSIPEFQQINSSQEFINFLYTPDSYGRNANAILENAKATRDVNAVINVINEFKATRQPAAPNQANRQVVQPVSVANQVHPNTQGSPQTQQTAPQGRIISVAEYRRTMQEITMRKYTPERARQLEAELDLAVREGRVQ